MMWSEHRHHQDHNPHGGSNTEAYSMNSPNDPNIGSKIMAEGMRRNAQSQSAQHHSRRQNSRKERWIKLGTLLVIIGGALWWVYS
jgi:hypothetical protein